MKRTRRPQWTARIGVITLALALSASILSACGASSNLPNAATVLRQAQHAKITDLKFTATGTFASSLSPMLTGQTSNTSTVNLQATVAGILTTSPRRADLSLTYGQQQQPALEIITDAGTNAGYFRLALLDQLGIGTGLWIRVPLDDLPSYLDTSIFSNFEQLTKPTMVGSETIQGVAVYLLRGEQHLLSGVGSATEDFYVRQDDALPARVSIHGEVNVPAQTLVGSTPAGEASVQVTITFTSANSGASIAVPDASQTVGW